MKMHVHGSSNTLLRSKGIGSTLGEGVLVGGEGGGRVGGEGEEWGDEEEGEVVCVGS